MRSDRIGEDGSVGTCRLQTGMGVDFRSLVHISVN